MCEELLSVLCVSVDVSLGLDDILDGEVRLQALDQLPRRRGVHGVEGFHAMPAGVPHLLEGVGAQRAPLSPVDLVLPLAAVAEQVEGVAHLLSQAVAHFAEEAGNLARVWVTSRDCRMWFFFQ